ncbi:lysophosphatidic acid receptor 6-like [Pelmatolapia mariae]|uniref:lysophosphatidic acid receptor 6-like n=1 Tax=Pelmatolapia mariae TaxID=158779 RepID=UPI002FE52318
MSFSSAIRVRVQLRKRRKGQHRSNEAVVTALLCLLESAHWVLFSCCTHPMTTVKFYFCRAQQQKPSSLTVYLKNLTAADFLLCLSLPLRITSYTSSSITIHQLHCSIGIPVLYFNMYSSILFMGYIAANRYLKIIHPSGTHMMQTVRAAKIISGVTWACLLAPTISFITTFFITQKPQTSDLRRCDSVFSASASLLGKVIHTCLGIIFLVVLISLIFRL